MKTGCLVDVSDHQLQDAERYIGRKADKNRKIYNGMIRTYYYQFLGPKPPKRREGETR